MSELDRIVEALEAGQDRSETQLRAKDRRTSVPPRIRVELTATLNAGGSAAAKPRIAVKGVLTTIDVPITVHDSIGTMAGIAGAYGAAEWKYDMKRWELYQLACPP